MIVKFGVDLLMTGVSLRANMAFIFQGRLKQRWTYLVLIGPSRSFSFQELSKCADVSRNTAQQLKVQTTSLKVKISNQVKFIRL